MNSISKCKFAVLGLGLFGMTLVKKLVAQNKYVAAVDKNMEPVDKIKNEVANAICFDATDSELLHKMRIIHADVVAISVGDNFKDAELIALELQHSGVEQIYVTVHSEQEEQIMRRIGITGVINPEVEAAERLAERLT